MDLRATGVFEDKKNNLAGWLDTDATLVFLPAVVLKFVSPVPGPCKEVIARYFSAMLQRPTTTINHQYQQYIHMGAFVYGHNVQNAAAPEPIKRNSGWFQVYDVQ